MKRKPSRSLPAAQKMALLEHNVRHIKPGEEDEKLVEDDAAVVPERRKWLGEQVCEADRA